MRNLERGMRGPDVVAWQKFLARAGFAVGSPDGAFGPRTETATKAFQTREGLPAVGRVGPQTLARAQALGFVAPGSTSEPPRDPEWPPRPPFRPLTSNAYRARVFGALAFRADPRPGDPERIEITNDYARKNLVEVEIPQLTRIERPVRRPVVTFHRLGATPLKTLWRRWEDEGLLPLVKTWDGGWTPRFVRGSRSVLSNHAFGTAFDINAAWNGLGVRPPLVGDLGSVRRLVPIAHELGFYWGGHFDRRDGMHFELTRVGLGPA